LQVSQLKDLFNKDYLNFQAEKKRWKSDFDRAAMRAVTQNDQILPLIKQCDARIRINSDAIKMINDAQMLA